MIEPRTIGVMGRLLDQADGLGVYSLHLLQHLFTLDPHTRYVIFLGTPNACEWVRRFPNAHPHVMPARARLFWDQVQVPRAARKFDVDLIFNPKFSIPLFSRRPSVFVLQGADWFVNPDSYPWWDNFYIRLMLPLYCRKATRLLAISQAALDDLARHTSIDVTNAAVTYAGIGPNFTAQRDAAALASFRAEYDLPERFMFTVARVQHTGHPNAPAYRGGNNERLVRAYQRYRRASAQPLPLVVAGRGVDSYLQARGFSAADLAGVRFVGFVPNDRIHLAYQLAHCFVLATLCESFGLPILEALATGCPAVVPNTCASLEVAGNAARLVDPRSEEDIARALAEVSESELLRVRLRQQGVQRAQRFSWQETARRTLEVFDQMLSAPELRITG